jgi:hypothetical protein
MPRARCGSAVPWVTEQLGQVEWTRDLEVHRRSIACPSEDPDSAPVIHRARSRCLALRGHGLVVARASLGDLAEPVCAGLRLHRPWFTPTHRIAAPIGSGFAPIGMLRRSRSCGCRYDCSRIAAQGVSLGVKPFPARGDVRTQPPFLRLRRPSPSSRGWLLRGSSSTTHVWPRGLRGCRT